MGNYQTTLSEFDSKVPEESSLLSRVRKIVLAYGWNSTSYQVVNPGMNYWFSEEGDAVIGFVSNTGVRVVAGAPICSEKRLPEIVDEFEGDAARSNERVCYLAAESRLESIYEKRKKYSKVLLGAHPIWQPSEWENIIKNNKSLRAQLNRARNKNVEVSEWSTEKARNNPQILDCLLSWLDSKGLPPLHFMVEPNTLSRLFDRRIFVAEIEKEVVGFVMLSPVAQRNGWLFEQFVHKPGSPNGTVELMIDKAMRALENDGYDYATLGLAPLSMRAEVAPFRNPFWIRLLLGWMRLHGKRFYNFDGLDAFKAKLRPKTWEPIFAITNESRISFRTIYAIAAAFSENKPIRLVFGGLWRALLTELNWFKKKLNKKALS